MMKVPKEFELEKEGGFFLRVQAPNVRTQESHEWIAQNTNNEVTHSGIGIAFSSRLDEVSPNGQILPITPTLKIFSFVELKKATRNFSPDRILGEGGFGRVFLGRIDEKTFAPTKAWSGMAIAVKKWNSDGFQGREERQVFMQSREVREFLSGALAGAMTKAILAPLETIRTSGILISET